MAMQLPVEEAREHRKRSRGVIGVQSRVPVKDRPALSLAYTPGVGYASLEIKNDPAASFDYTNRGNLVGIVTDGSAVLHLGSAGPEAALPVMEAKSAIFKTFAGVDAIPICIDASSVEEIVETAAALAPTFGAFCLEDIASPACFAIEQQLTSACDVAVVGNHQDTTAAVVLAGLMNALRLVGKPMTQISVVISGAGAGGIALAKTLVRSGAKDVVLCDRDGAVYRSRPRGMNWAKREIAKITNTGNKQGTLAEVMPGVDVFVGLSAGGLVTSEMVRAMAEDPIVFALAVPEPEIMPEQAVAGGARIVATGRSDYPNQIDIALAFPGLFRGLLDVRALKLNAEMVEATAEAIAGMVEDHQLRPDNIVPKIMDFRIAPAIAAAVARAAIETGEARVSRDPELIAEDTKWFVYEGHLPVPPRPVSAGGRLSFQEQALDLRKRHRGVLEIRNKVVIKDELILNALYLPPAAAEPVEEIHRDPSKVYELTAKSNLVAVVSDGSAVLGLGNIGPEAAMPVMEGKAVLFNTFAGVEAFPICLATQDPDEIVEIVKRIAPAFGAVNLEDISAPRCFAIERRLKEITGIPIFHDDQHGTAVIVLAALINALKITGKDLSQLRIAVNGCGAAGVAVTKMLLSYGVTDVVVSDIGGIVYQGRRNGMNWAMEELAQVTNRDKIKGGLAEAVAGRDIFVGVSAARVLTQEMVRSMAADPIIFALANPIPEIMPDEAKAAGAKIVATGRSDFENQVNNSLAFPGIFRGALDTRATDINEAMKIAAATAIAGLVGEKELGPDYILPSGVDFRVAPRVAAAVAEAAMESGVAGVQVDPAKVEESTLSWVYEGRLMPVS